MSKKYIITRHPGAAEWLDRTVGLSGAELVAHAGDEFWTGLQVGDVVIGTLPIHLAARACEATGNPFGFLAVNLPPDARGKELTAEEMEAYGASISWFEVRPAVAPGDGA